MPADNYRAPIEIHGLTKNFGAVRALDGLLRFNGKFVPTNGHKKQLLAVNSWLPA